MKNSTLWHFAGALVLTLSSILSSCTQPNAPTGSEELKLFCAFRLDSVQTLDSATEHYRSYYRSGQSGHTFDTTYLNQEGTPLFVCSPKRWDNVLQRSDGTQIYTAVSYKERFTSTHDVDNTFDSLLLVPDANGTYTMHLSHQHHKQHDDMDRSWDESYEDDSVFVITLKNIAKAPKSGQLLYCSYDNASLDKNMSVSIHSTHVHQYQADNPYVTCYVSQTTLNSNRMILKGSSAATLQYIR